MSFASDDYIDSIIDESRTKKIDDYIEAIGNDPVIDYLGKYGESIEQRVQSCRDEATNLMNLGFCGPSLAASVTGIEIAIRFFLFRPIVQGAFLSEEWADTLADRIVRRRTADDREMLPNILRHWGWN